MKGSDPIHPSPPTMTSPTRKRQSRGLRIANVIGSRAEDLSSRSHGRK